MEGNHMPKKIAATMALALFSMTTYGQNWMLEGAFPDESGWPQSFGQGIAIDGEGKIWYQSYYASETIFVDGFGDKDCRAIYVFNPDGTQASFSPIKSIEVGGIIDTLWGQNRGLRTDPNGDVVAASDSIYFRIDHETGVGLQRLVPYVGDVVLTTPAFDQNGNMFTCTVYGGNPIKVFNSNWELIQEAIPAVMHNDWSRTIAVEPNGSAIYYFNTDLGIGVIRFNSSDNTVYGDYTSTIDTLYKDMQVEAATWDRNGKLWMANNIGSGFTNSAVYAYDPASESFVDSIIFDPELEKPRSFDFNTDESQVYFTFFDNNHAIYKYSKIPPSHTWYISTIGSDATGDGSESNPFATIQAGLNAADSTDTVLVQPGTYTENIIWPQQHGIYLKGVGGTEQTIINGSGNGSVVTFFGLSIVYDASTVIDGFSINNGSTIKGGGVFINNGSPTLKDLNLTNNLATQYGGGLYIEGNSNPIIEHSKFIDNHCNSTGGGLSVYAANCSIRDSEFLENSSLIGGGISIISGTALVENLLIFGNSGGGIDIDNGTVNGDSLIIVENYTSGNGGGIRLQGGGCNSAFTIISKNRASGYGGAVYQFASSVDFENLSILENYSDSYSNGIHFQSAGPNLISNSNLSNGGYSLYSGGNLHTATNNWWGDPTGPYHQIENPMGQGDTANNYIQVTPWLISPSTDAPPISAQNLVATGTGNDFISLAWDSSPLGDFAGFKLYYDTDESGYPYSNNVDIGMDTSFTLSGLNLGTEYYLSVTVYDTEGNESWYSQEVTGTTRVMEAQNLDIAGEEDLQHLITHDPLITFDYYDSMGETQTNYQIQISTDSTFQSNLIWDIGEVANDATSIQYTEGSLQNGVKYYLRARVASSSFWSNWTNLAFGMNTEPSIPTQLSLIDNEVTTSDVLLSISNSIDAEGDELSYDFRLYDATQTVQIDSAIGVAQNTDVTMWEVTTALDDNAQHWWTVQAYDGYEYSELAGPSSFLINLENDVPAGFSLTSPLVGEAITSQSPLFTWDPAVDPDPLDTVKYILYLDTPDPGVETFDVDMDTSFQLLDVLQDNTSYHWKVVASDLAGATTTNTGGYQSFTVNISNDLPDAFNLLAPIADMMVTTLTPEFLWEASADPDDETIALRATGKGKFSDSRNTGGNSVMVITGYDFYLSTDASLAGAIPVEIIGTNYVPTEDLLENQVYYWAVSALDDSGGVTFSDTASFWTNYQNDLPEAFSMLDPVGLPLLGLSTLTPSFSWTSSSDADLNDELIYRLQLGTSTWDMHEVYVGSESSWTPTEPLWDDTVYSWQVLAEDLSGAVTIAGIGDSAAFAHFYTNVENESPDPALLLSPDSVVVLTDTPTFIWERSFDPDPFEQVNYEVHWWYEGSEWDSILTEETSVRISNPLTEDNKQYFWQVISMDDEGGLAQSEDFMFWVDFLPEPPATFALLGPEDESAGNSTRPELTWQPSLDPDPFDNVYYQIAISTDSNMVDIVYEGTAIPESHILEIDLQNDTRYYWQVSANDEDSLQTISDVWTFDVGYVAIDDGLELPTEYVLDQNYPNPFNPSTTIRYGLPEDSNVLLVIYDVRGQVVQTLESGHQSAGWYDVVWNGQTADGKTISTGIYFARLVAGDYSQVIKMLYLK